MIQISPQQKIWTTIRMLSVELGYSTYDYLPDSKAEYPFVFIGESFKQDSREHKDYLNGYTQVTVHVWHNDYRKRGDLTKMMAELEDLIRLEYLHRVQGVNTQVLTDNSTGSNLLHGILEIEIKY